MIISTTNNIEGKTIKDYRGVVFGEVVNGISYAKDFAAAFTSFTGGRSKEYEQELVVSRADALSEMISRAAQIGANAIIGVKVDYEAIESLLVVVASGTAVIVE